MPLLLKLLPVVSIVLLYGARLCELFAKRETVKGRVRETGTLKLFMVVGLLVTFGGSHEYWYLRGSVEWTGFVAGWVASIASFALRAGAIRALGKFWSIHVEIRDGHQFVQSGPFRWVRHPAYLSMILEILGGCLILRAWWTMGLAYLIFFPVLVMRVRIEERALIEKFGDAYKRYRSAVPALIPWKGRAL
jgi:protein-S-isoprenylcysteine O-methyltransferase Ste14